MASEQASVLEVFNRAKIMEITTSIENVKEITPPGHVPVEFECQTTLRRRFWQSVHEIQDAT